MSTIENSNHTAGLFDIGTCAVRLGRTERFVRRLVEDNRIPFVKVGKFVMFDPEEIDAWIDSKRVPQKHFD